MNKYHLNTSWLYMKKEVILKTGYNPDLILHAGELSTAWVRAHVSSSSLFLSPTLLEGLISFWILQRKEILWHLPCDKFVFWIWGIWRMAGGKALTFTSTMNSLLLWSPPVSGFPAVWRQCPLRTIPEHCRRQLKQALGVSHPLAICPSDCASLTRDLRVIWAGDHSSRRKRWDKSLHPIVCCCCLWNKWRDLSFPVSPHRFTLSSELAVQTQLCQGKADSFI